MHSDHVIGENISFEVVSATHEEFRIKISGRLDAKTTGSVWKETFRILEQKDPRLCVIDTISLGYCDGSGISYLIAVSERQEEHGNVCEFKGLTDDLQRLYDTFRKTAPGDPGEKRGRINFFVKVGQSTCRLCNDMVTLLAYAGELSANLVEVTFKRRMLRWKDIWHFVEIGGVDAIPIVIFLNFLMGLIMAFQSAIPMKQFGADIFVADLVALSMTRELGPLMTAVILAGRTGSAYAAELGTMKVNEELDALNTMGLYPVKFLAMNRIVAVLILMPALTLIGVAAGILGGSFVFTSLGYPIITYFNKVTAAVSLDDFLGGFVKCFVFGLLIAGIGCLRGLQAKSGASAVGTSATRAVVSGMTLIILADGVFSIIYYYLGI